MLRWLILWTALAMLSEALIRAGARKQPKPPHREGWHTDVNGPYWD
jgi:hypothetical protein